MEEKTERSIGEYLQSFRKEQGIMLRDISEKTCISVKYLENIENDNYDDMGGIGYAKAITVSYAKALGANDKLVLHLFNSRYTKPVPKTLYRREHQPRKFMIPTSIFSILLLVVLIAALSLVIVRLHEEGKLSFPFRDLFNSAKTEKAKVENSKVKNSVSIYDSLQEEKKANKQQKKNLSESQGVQIDISALQDSTDYTDKYLFKGKDSPYNVKDD